MDEPTAGLDPIAASSLREDLASLASSEGVTIFLTTHNLDEAEKLCDLVGVIRDGEVITVGHPDELRSNNFSPSVTISGSGFTDQIIKAVHDCREVTSVELEENQLHVQLTGSGKTSPIVRTIVMAGGEVEEVRRVRATLEEVFLLLMQENSK
jgi:ABC-2 type transport system ATP-binding protein